MSGRVFWVAATILLAIVVHLTYVLFAPGDSVQRKLQAMRTLAGVNSLKVLSANDSRTFLAGEGPGLVHAADPLALRRDHDEVVAAADQRALAGGQQPRDPLDRTVQPGRHVRFLFPHCQKTSPAMKRASFVVQNAGSSQFKRAYTQ